MSKNTNKKKTRAVDKIFSKSVIFFSSALIVFIVFRKPIEGFASCNIVDLVLNNVQSVWYNDLIFLLLIAVAVLFFSTRPINYVPSKPLSVSLFVVTAIYLIYRLFGDVWIFTPFSILRVFKYTDILIVISIGQLYLLRRATEKISFLESKAFFHDEPYFGRKDIHDLLGYRPYAEQLSKKLKHSFYKTSFAIGINGKWGSGKTSFINILKDELVDEDTIEINFKPWSSSNPQAIIKDFFETFQAAIRPYNASLSKLFLDYSNRLVSIDSNRITQSIRTSASAITGLDSIGGVYDEIDSALKDINKKIIIFIDDLDRLDKDEIMEVIRLIRNTANFPNTLFVVAYDRGYVVNALKKHNDYKQEEFLEKIFQIEVSLPYFDKNILRIKLAEQLRKQLDVKYHDTINEAIIGTPASVPKHLNEWLDTLRDVTRLANTLVLNLEKLFGETVFDDLLRIELLRIKYPKVHELIHKNTTRFFILASDNNPGHEYYQLITISDNPRLNNVTPEEKGINTMLEQYLFRNNDQLLITKSEIPRIIEFVKNLFSLGYGHASINTPSKLSIVYPSKFNRYFAYRLLEGSLSEIEFSKARALSQDQFNEQIKEWVELGVEDELKLKFKEIVVFDNREDFEKIISAIFYFANLESKRDSYFKDSIVGYDGQDLIRKLSNYDDALVKAYYPFNNGKNESKDFIKGLFADAKSPFYFEADLLLTIKEKYGASFILNNEEIQEITIQYFKSYCKTSTRFDRNFWNLFHCSKEIRFVKHDDGRITHAEHFPDESILIIKEMIREHTDSFILAVTKQNIRDEKLYAISDIVPRIYGDWQSFKAEIDALDDDKSTYVKEFQDFLKVFEKSGFMVYVEFDFEVIKVENKGM